MTKTKWSQLGLVQARKWVLWVGPFSSDNWWWGLDLRQGREQWRSGHKCSELNWAAWPTPFPWPFYQLLQRGGTGPERLPWFSIIPHLRLNTAWERHKQALFLRTEKLSSSPPCSFSWWFYQTLTQVIWSIAKPVPRLLCYNNVANGTSKKASAYMWGKNCRQVTFLTRCHTCDHTS